MTAGETRNVEGREATIHHEATADHAVNGGHVPAPERQQINQRQNNVSGAIREDKHNEAKQPRAEGEHHGEGHPHER